MPSISLRVENVEPLRRYPDFVVVYLLGVYFGRQRECGGAYPLFSEADGVYGVGFLRSFLGDVRYSLSFSTRMRSFSTAAVSLRDENPRILQANPLV